MGNYIPATEAGVRDAGPQQQSGGPCLLDLSFKSCRVGEIRVDAVRSLGMERLEEKCLMGRCELGGRWDD